MNDHSTSPPFHHLTRPYLLHTCELAYSPGMRVLYCVAESSMLRNKKKIYEKAPIHQLVFDLFSLKNSHINTHANALVESSTAFPTNSLAHSDEFVVAESHVTMNLFWQANRCMNTAFTLFGG